MGRGLSELQNWILVRGLTPTDEARRRQMDIVVSDIIRGYYGRPGAAAYVATSRALTRLHARGLLEIYYAWRCLRGNGALGYRLSLAGLAVAKRAAMPKRENSS